MAISVSIPTIWSARILEYLDKMLVYAQALTNRDYEGEITPGATVKILQVGDVTVSDYTGDLGNPNDLTDSAQDLVINQKKAFTFKVDDVDQEFSVLRLVDAGSQRAAYALADTLDQYIASFYAQADAANLYGNSTTPIVIGGGTGEVRAYDAHLELAQLLSEANVPEADRRAVYPHWFIRRLKKELGGRNSGLGDNITQSGEVGVVDGVRIFASNNVPNTAGAKFKAIMGIPKITMAQAIAKVETHRMQNAFATRVNGLWVYGAKLTHPKALAVGTFDKGNLTA